MKFVAVLPPSENLPEQTAMIGALLEDHDLAVATSAEELAPHLADAEILVSTAFTPLDRSALESAKSLRLIQVAGVGADHVDLEAAKELGISVAAVSGANTTSVAEHVVMTVLGLLRGAVPAHNAMAGGGWPLPEWMGHAQDLAGKTVGILGMGRIGKAVAERLLPFEVTLLYHDPQPLDPDEEDLLGVTPVDLEGLLRQSDIVTLHLPLVDSTRGLLDRARLRSMKQGAYLVNASRAELVDEAALVEALQDHLGGAALDVFHPEPPAADDPLRGLPNVILTPHGAGVTKEAQERIAMGVMQNLMRYLDGHPIADLLVEGTR